MQRELKSLCDLMTGTHAFIHHFSGGKELKIACLSSDSPSVRKWLYGKILEVGQSSLQLKIRMLHWDEAKQKKWWQRC